MSQSCRVRRPAAGLAGPAQQPARRAAPIARTAPAPHASRARPSARWPAGPSEIRDRAGSGRAPLVCLSLEPLRPPLRTTYQAHFSPQSNLWLAFVLLVAGLCLACGLPVACLWPKAPPRSGRAVGGMDRQRLCLFSTFSIVLLGHFHLRGGSPRARVSCSTSFGAMVKLRFLVTTLSPPYRWP